MEQTYTLKEVRAIKQKAREEGYKRGFKAANREKKNVKKYLASPAHPPVNGELLGFLEIEIEKANKNGKDCNLKDADLNRAQAWYSAAEAFSIVKNKVIELFNTSHGHESSIINCPSCNASWDLSRHNSCQCGATLATKASPAKAEQEGPWKVKVEHSPGAHESGCSGDTYVVLTDGRVELYFDGGMEDDDEQLLCNFLNERQIKLDYNHEAEMVAGYLEAEVKRLTKAPREQEGLSWVNAHKANFELNKVYCAMWDIGEASAVEYGQGYFESAEGFAWSDSATTVKSNWDNLYILLESAPKEAGQVDPEPFFKWIDDELIYKEPNGVWYKWSGIDKEANRISESTSHLYQRYLESLNKQQ